MGRANAEYEVKYVSMKSNKKLYPYRSAKPLKTAGCFVATVTARNVTVEAELIIIEGRRPSITTKRDSYTTECLVPWRGG